MGWQWAVAWLGQKTLPLNGQLFLRPDAEGLPPEAARRAGWATIHAVSLKQLADFDSPPLLPVSAMGLSVPLPLYN